MKVKIDEDNWILCPWCGHHETHQAEPSAFEGVGSSGGGTSILLFCDSCEKEWELSILQHKGLTLIDNFRVGEGNTHRIYENGASNGDLIKLYKYFDYRELAYSHYEKNNTIEKTLKKALLEGVDLRYAVFIGKDFSNSKLMGLNLNNMTFSRCNMQNVNLIGSSLNGTYFRGSDLTGAKYTQEQEKIINPQKTEW